MKPRASDGVAKSSSCSHVSDSVLVTATSGGFPTCALRTVEVRRKFVPFQFAVNVRAKLLKCSFIF